jgi:sugar O-acyltransferase (sialic acid O-acetyltransferase NeuD family)
LAAVDALSVAGMEIVFWGATGQAKVLRELIAQEGLRLVAVFDNSELLAPFSDVPLYHGRDGFAAWRASRTGELPRSLVAIGGARGRDRIELQRFLAGHGVFPHVAVHRTAFVAGNARLGVGSQVLAHAAVCVEAQLGEACIVNTSATVDHECILGDGVHVCPGAHLAGCVRVGDFAMIGTGASVLPRMSIGSGAIVGAGAVVIHDVPQWTVVAGNPARVVREIDPDAIEGDRR